MGGVNEGCRNDPHIVYLLQGNLKGGHSPLCLFNFYHPSFGMPVFPPVLEVTRRRRGSPLAHFFFDVTGEAVLSSSLLHKYSFFRSPFSLDAVHIGSFNLISQRTLRATELRAQSLILGLSLQSTRTHSTLPPPTLHGHDGLRAILMGDADDTDSTRWA